MICLILNDLCDQNFANLICFSISYPSSLIERLHMTLIEVTEKKHIKEFLQLPVRLYKNEANWIRPLDKDIEEVFDPQKNKLFRQGECTRWILKDAQGLTIGRVAAFINKKTIHKDNEQPTGGMGFFECINDQVAANVLFDACKAWLEERGIEAMDGPINFGDRDKWWGCLAEGFHEPNYCMPYNFAYYKDLFEGYGFQDYFKQYTFRRPVAGRLIDKMYDKAKRIYDDPAYDFRHLRIKEMEKYAEDFRTVYNEAWGKHGGVAKMSKAQALVIMKTIKPIMDETIIWFAYHNDEPVGFFIMLPEINQVVKHLNGQFNWWAKLKFLWYLKVVKIEKMFGVVFGVVPKYQGKGIEAAIVVAFTKIGHVPNYQYKEFEMNWIGDFNPKMIRVAEDVGGILHKTHITFRKLFDETKPFKRMKVIN